MSLPGSAAPPSADGRRDYFARRSGEAVIGLIKAGITARDIMTRDAFDNAIAVVMALGGSTNAVLHLLAIAHEAGVDLTLDDFNTIADRVPHLADVKPFGRYVMNDVDRVGGIPVIMNALLGAGLIHGDALTVTGRTVAENLAAMDLPPLDGEVRAPARPPDPRQRRAEHPARQPGPGRRRGEDRRLRSRRVCRSGKGFRPGAGRDGRAGRGSRSRPVMWW